jgi:hypothetical protein
VGEVLAVDRNRIRLALWPGSTAAVNLAPRGAHALITIIEDGPVWAVHGSTMAGRGMSVPGFQTVTAIEVEVDEVRCDSVDYAVIETGVRFRLLDPGQVLPRWRATRRALADAGLPD